MNQQVKKLIQQVGTDVSGKWISTTDANKLVELVVEECANQCLSDDSMRILIHFGIKK